MFLIKWASAFPVLFVEVYYYVDIPLYRGTILCLQHILTLKVKSLNLCFVDLFSACAVGVDVMQLSVPSEFTFSLPQFPHSLVLFASSLHSLFCLSPSHLLLRLKCLTLCHCRRSGHSIFLPDHEETVHSPWVGADWVTISLPAETVKQFLQILGTHNIINGLPYNLSSLYVLVSKGKFHQSRRHWAIIWPTEPGVYSWSRAELASKTRGNQGCPHTHTHTHACTHIHTHIYAHVHTHTYTLSADTE